MKTRLLLSSPFLLLLALLFNPVKVLAQGTQINPDCVIFINVTLSAQATVSLPTNPTAGGVGDNRTLGCQTYTLTYQATGAGALTSVDFQAGQSSSTTVTFATWAGTISTGINPNTSSTGATSSFSTGCVSAAACTVANSWLRILITRGTFVGTINGVLYGYKSGSSGAGGGGGTSCLGTAATPCVVDGPTASGSAPTKPPVMIAGIDGTNVRTIATDTSGQLLLSSVAQAQADGSSNTPNVPTMGVAGAASPTTFRMFPYFFNSSTWDRSFGCTLQAAVTISAGTDTVLVAGVAATNIRVCHFDFSSNTAATFTIRQGTGATCGTNTATLAGDYPNTLTFAMDYQPLASLNTTVAARDLCLHSSATVTVGGFIKYAQF